VTPFRSLLAASLMTLALAGAAHAATADDVESCGEHRSAMRTPFGLVAANTLRAPSVRPAPVASAPAPRAAQRSARPTARPVRPRVAHLPEAPAPTPGMNALLFMTGGAGEELLGAPARSGSNDNTSWVF
jgi:hypothetical protein